MHCMLRPVTDTQPNNPLCNGHQCHLSFYSSATFAPKSTNPLTIRIVKLALKHSFNLPSFQNLTFTRSLNMLNALFVWVLFKLMLIRSFTETLRISFPFYSIFQTIPKMIQNNNYIKIIFKMESSNQQFFHT